MILPKLFEILKDLNNNREKLLLYKKKMSEHSDKDSLSKVTRFIENFLNEKINIGSKEKNSLYRNWRNRHEWISTGYEQNGLSCSRK